MKVSRFIDNYREAFGAEAELPTVFGYSDVPIADTPKIGGCFFRELARVRAGGAASLNGDNITCGGGLFYTGFGPLRPSTPAFVSLEERYKETPELVLDHIARSDIAPAPARFLNLVRLDALVASSIASPSASSHNNFEGVEGLIFFAAPDRLSGLAAWAWFDNNDEGAVTTRFGSGCSTIITDPARENRLGGRRTFIGCMDISVRPYLAPDELSFAIPMSRFREMYATLPRTSLMGPRAWQKLRSRII